MQFKNQFPHSMTKLSIIIPTYNHGKFIAQTIEGCLMQQTNFEFELLIGDDASTDNNALIISEYQAKFPNKIKAFLHKENLGPAHPRELGGKNNVAFLFKQAKSPYIALCEGDDYWTDPLKLQKQVDFLDANPDFALVHHQLEVIYEDNSPSHFFNDEDQQETSNLTDLLKDEKWILGTASTVFRNTIQGNFPDWWMKSASGDLGIFFLATAHGKIKYMNECMGAYRKHRGGMTNIHTPQNLIFLRNRMEMFETLNTYFDFKYDSILQQTILNFKEKIKEVEASLQ